MTDSRARVGSSGRERRGSAPRQRASSKARATSPQVDAPEEVGFPRGTLTAADYSQSRFDRHAALLGDSRLSRPMYARQRADLVRQLQRDYGNRYVQRLVDHVSQQQAEPVQTQPAAALAGDKLGHMVGRSLNKTGKLGISGGAKPGAVQRKVTPPTYANADITGAFNGNVGFNETVDTVTAQSPALDLDGTVDITAAGTPDSQNAGIEVGFIQTLAQTSVTAKYQPGPDGKEERAQITVAPQPVRDGDKGKTPWYEVNDVEKWDGTVGATLTPELYDRPMRGIPRYGEKDGQEIYEVVGQDKFTTWLISWKDKKAKYLYYYTWEVNFTGDKGAGAWVAAGASTNTGSGAGRGPGGARLGDPVANDSATWRFRKV